MRAERRCGGAATKIGSKVVASFGTNYVYVLLLVDVVRSTRSKDLLQYWPEERCLCSSK